MEPLIEVQSFFFKYYFSKDWVLKNINFNLYNNETLLILGPNGSGKTTLVLSLLGILQRYKLGEYKGKIIIKGKELTEDYSLKVYSFASIVQQDPEAQIVNLYVKDEVAFALENLCYDEKLITEKVYNTLKLVGLYEKRNHETYSLSYGEKQKLILASVLVLDSNILIFDEPTSNLDPYSRKVFFELVKRLKKEGKTIIIIEHNIDELLDIIDKVLILNKNGEIHAFGKIDLLFTESYETFNELGIWVPYKWEILFYLNKIKNFKIDEESFIKYLKDIPLLKPKINYNKCLKLDKIYFSYNSDYILKNINLEFLEGNIYAILGHNGAGKTTLCKIIGGIYKPTKGKILFYDKNLEKNKDKQIKYCFQNPEVQFISKTVLDEILLSLKFSKGKADINLAKNILNFVNLEQFSYENPFNLSEGQKKLLSIAIALAYEPKVLIFDEPTFALDSFNSKKIMQYIYQLKYKNKLLIFSTHEIRNCLEYADYVIVLNKGEVVFFDTIDKFLFFIDELEKFSIYLPSYIKNLANNKEELIDIVYRIRYLKNEVKI